MDNVALVINAGGQSRRMGQPKALLPLPPENRPLLEVIVQRLHPLAAQQVVIIANDSAIRTQTAVGPDVLWLTDRYPGVGPLGGLATGLAACDGWAICVACDLPLLNPALFTYFVELATGTDGWDAIVPVVDDYPEPLHALYHRRCLPTIIACLAAGERRASGFLSAVRTHYVPEVELRRLDPALHSFYNANTPEEWAQVLILLGQGIPRSS